MKKRKTTREMFHFKRWSRKRYAVFASLKKQVVISTIALGCSFLLKPTDGIAQQKSDSVIHTLKGIEISADAPPDGDLLENTLLQAVFTQKEIERVPIQSLSDLLEHLPGIDIRQRGAFGTQADISYRGGNFDQTMLLLNGINFTDPQTGHYSLNLPISPEIIKKIELYNNTTAFLFGTSPFSGLLNLITRPDTLNDLRFYLSGGMYGLIRTGAALNVKSGKTAHLLSADYSHSNGYRHNTDFTIGNVFYQNLTKFQKGELEFQSGYSNKNYGANGFYSLRFPDQYESTKTVLAGLRYKHIGKIEWSPAIYYRANWDRFELVKGAAPSQNNYHRNQIGGINFLTAFRSIAGKSSFSADFRIEDIISTSLGEAIQNPIAMKVDTLFYTHRRTRGNFGISASHLYSAKGWRAQVTLLGQHFTDIRNKFYLLPAGFVAYHFKSRVFGATHFSGNLSLSGSKTVRTPTFTDLYYKTGDILGNSALLPEQAYTIELAGELNLRQNMAKQPYFSAWFALFNRYGIDMIDYVKHDNEIIWQTVNHTKITFYGFDVSLQWNPRQQFHSKFFIHKISLNYSYLYSNKESKGYQSRYVSDHLVHHLALQISHRIYKGLGMDYTITFNQRKGEYTSFTEDSAGSPHSYPSYTLIDLKIYYDWKILHLYIEASNILNYKYFDLGDIEQPGIWIRGGVKCKIGI